MKKITTKEFIKKSKEIHSDKYDYSLVIYSNMKTKVKIICQEHGVFEQRPDHHINENGCPKCKGNLLKNLKTKKIKDFIEESKKIHANKYNYSLVDYKNAHTKVKIICPNHGVFKQTPNSHLMGNGCNNCGFISMSEKRKINFNEIVEKSNIIHKNKYKYNINSYTKSIDKMEIICPLHGFFYKSPNNHISKKQGCPKCKQSNGERKIEDFLIKNKIKYKYQKTFNDLKYIKKLRYDFYLLEHNICIEYDGEQHFKPMIIWGGDKEFKKILIRDKIKNEYCKENNIDLIRIKYNENIEKILKEKINLL